MQWPTLGQSQWPRANRRSQLPHPGDCPVDQRPSRRNGRSRSRPRGGRRHYPHPCGGFAAKLHTKPMKRRRKRSAGAGALDASCVCNAPFTDALRAGDEPPVTTRRCCPHVVADTTRPADREATRTLGRQRTRAGTGENTRLPDCTGPHAAIVARSRRTGSMHSLFMHPVSEFAYGTLEANEAGRN